MPGRWAYGAMEPSGGGGGGDPPGIPDYVASWGILGVTGRTGHLRITSSDDTVTLTNPHEGADWLFDYQVNADIIARRDWVTGIYPVPAGPGDACSTMHVDDSGKWEISDKLSVLYAITIGDAGKSPRVDAEGNWSLEQIGLPSGAEGQILRHGAVVWAGWSGSKRSQIIFSGIAGEGFPWDRLDPPESNFPQQLECGVGPEVSWQHRAHIPDPTGQDLQLVRVKQDGSIWEMFMPTHNGDLIVGFLNDKWTVFSPQTAVGYTKYDGAGTYAIVGPIPVTDIAPAGAGTHTLKSVAEVVQWVEDA